MQEILKLLIGIAILVAGWFIGNILAKYTKEELKPGRGWFKMIVLAGLVLGLAGLILSNDVLLFTGFFIAIVSSRSLKS